MLATLEQPGCGRISSNARHRKACIESMVFAISGLTSKRWRSCAPSGRFHDRGRAGSATSRLAEAIRPRLGLNRSDWFRNKRSCSIISVPGSAVTSRASGVSSGIFVHQDYCAVWLPNKALCIRRRFSNEVAYLLERGRVGVSVRARISRCKIKKNLAHPTRKNALFAGSDGGAEHWAAIASLIETCKLNDVDPVAYPTTSSPGSSTAIRTARSTNCSPGPIDVKTSKP